MTGRSLLPLIGAGQSTQAPRRCRLPRARAARERPGRDLSYPCRAVRHREIPLHPQPPPRPLAGGRPRAGPFGRSVRRRRRLADQGPDPRASRRAEFRERTSASPSRSGRPRSCTTSSTTRTRSRTSPTTRPTPRSRPSSAPASTAGWPTPATPWPTIRHGPRAVRRLPLCRPIRRGSPGRTAAVGALNAVPTEGKVKGPGPRSSWG